jgi:two-component system LytT family response regulator
MKIRTLIVDDEPLARERIRTLLADEPDLEIIGECANGSEAVGALQSQQPERKWLERLVIKSGGRVFFLKVEEIDWIEAAGNYVRLHAGREPHLLRETIKSLETQLDPNKFLRINRSTIVRIDRIKELQPWFHGEHAIILQDGTQLPSSRGYGEKLGEFLGKSL